MQNDAPVLDCRVYECRVLLVPGVMAPPVLCMVMRACGLILWEFSMMSIAVSVG